MAVVLVTGMSGVGKSAVLGGLARLGYRVVDSDHGDWVADLPLPDGTSEPQWREDRIDALISEHERSGEPLVIAGTVVNQGRFYPRFAEVVLLSAPLAVMLDRVAARDTNPFGKTAEDRAKIAADTAGVEPLLRASATVEIDTRAPLDEVVARVAALVSGGASRR
ncbi:AAA family ATPase [Actinokineospora cianjurensis]|uniref:Shikimate kinase n=1 Tax=Actinokineospora cianjurensis TaxID=585224 RepID=A0A421BCV4_9PSEU|nr:AAA family ATPase [Actinokineospora cianjurensis]RLK62177.1 shikimate kinase [Actinokineospora cianjurensis]